MYSDIADIIASGRGRIRTDLWQTQAGTARSFAPPKGFLWFLIGGIVTHVTGTNTIVWVRNSPDANPTIAIADAAQWSWYSMVASGDASGDFPLFRRTAENYVGADGQPIIITTQDRIWFTGAATSELRPVVLEVQLEWKK